MRRPAPASPGFGLRQAQPSRIVVIADAEIVDRQQLAQLQCAIASTAARCWSPRDVGLVGDDDQQKAALPSAAPAPRRTSG